MLLRLSMALALAAGTLLLSDSAGVAQVEPAPTVASAAE
jgi:hypothetical protein